MIGILNASHSIRRSVYDSLSGAGIPEVVANLSSSRPFLVADNHHRTPVQTRNTATTALSSCKRYASQFVKFVECRANIIQVYGRRGGVPVEQPAMHPDFGEDFTRQFNAFSRRRCTSSSMLISSFSS